MWTDWLNENLLQAEFGEGSRAVVREATRQRLGPAFNQQGMAGQLHLVVRSSSCRFAL